MAFACWILASGTVLALSEAFVPTKPIGVGLPLSVSPSFALPSRDPNISIDQLLDRAVLLYQSCDEQKSSIREQASSLVGYLSTKKDNVVAEQDIARMRQQKAKEIDDALLKAVPFSEMQTLVDEFRSLQEKTASSDIEAELQAVQRQLETFEELTAPANTETNSMRPVEMTKADSAYLAVDEVRESSQSENTPRRSPIITSLDTKTSDESDDSQDPLLQKDIGDVSDVHEDTAALDTSTQVPNSSQHQEEEVDIAIVGAGLAALCAGAILNTLYGKKVGIYESHYLAGGCAHAFDRKAENGVTFNFDSGPTILLGCSSEPFNALEQVLRAVGQTVEWIPYDGWGMIESPATAKEARWKVKLGPDSFEEGPLKTFGGETAVKEFLALKDATKDLIAGATIPAMAMRSDSNNIYPLLRYFWTLFDLIKQGETVTGTFAPFMDGPLFTVKDPWLRNWLDALAFSLSGLPASRTAAAAMAFVLNDMHRPGAALDYPKGGMGEIVDALVRGVEQGTAGSKVHLRSHVESIDCNDNGTRITGLTLSNGKRIRARGGVICNAPVWSLKSLIKDKRVLKTLSNQMPLLDAPPNATWKTTSSGSSIALSREEPSSKSKASVLARCDSAEMTGSFIHLHLAIDATGLDKSKLEAHYTVMDRSLSGDGSSVNGITDGPCGETNMIAVSNPCVIDPTLAPEGYMVLHAYGAGNEPYEIWEGLDRRSPEYAMLKEERAKPLWRAVESVIPDIQERVVYHLIGSPLTHERFLRRPRGTYGSATEDYLKDGSTPFDSLIIANDGVFPGIGVPSVAIAGASAANAFVTVRQQWSCLDKLKREGKIA